ncbi:unnamed protein product [Rotaria sp. Silwood2]|nr:unnamed protein product [Rotaria sp. Silwood2]CAF3169391.1 unnamed protein product [Rotaria sp. Silwood2]CAF3875487.1 unnamed protein product [Rotaria sp. Silwood2]CAF4087958.1 unnamed protein product [Rotaria sp. Silwood2]CAF4552581.1 unnamed protein product [Rotaria sp. Silwood2]
MNIFKNKFIRSVTPLVISETQQQNNSSATSTSYKKTHYTIEVPLSTHEINSRKRNFCQQCCSKESLKEQALLITTVASVLIGIAVGLGLRNFKCNTDEYINGCRLTKEDIGYIEFPGTIFIHILKLLILPLIVSSIISSLAQLDAQSSGKMGLRALIYYFGTTIIAAIIGIILVLSIRPGLRGGQVEIKPESKTVEGRTVDTILDLIRNLFPENIVQAAFQTTGTKLTVKKKLIVGENNTTYNKTVYNAVLEKRDGINVLGLLLFCILFGIIISRLKEKALILKQFFEAMLEVVMQLVRIAMLFSPIGIFFLIVAKILYMDSLSDFAGSLGLYMVTVLAGLFIHGFIILPLILFIITRMNVFKYIRGMSQALVTAFGTASSSATLPVTYRCVEEKNHIDPRVSRFVLPVGATVNMDGTALYEAVAAIYIAQLNGIPLNAVKIIVTTFTSTLASIGAASIPQAGLVTMVIVLNALGLPAEEVRTIFAVDWLLDRFRTAINVFGDSIGCAVVNYLSRKELDALDNKKLLPDDGDTNNPNSSVSFLVPNNTTMLSSNHVPPVIFDNPTYSNQPETTVDDDDNIMAQTSF